MKIIADLQLHSKYSRAVSQKMNVEEIFSWAVKKGIGLVATGDWTHPLWLREIKAKLIEDGSGFLQLKSHIESENPKSKIQSSKQNENPQFLLATEISSIYTQGGKVRRIHNLVWAPSFATVDKIIAELNKRDCNLGSDGRPIVGLTSRDITELVLAIDEKCLVIPAHAWTPWFSLYGSKSGFDSIEECFGDYAQYIYAIETGLSSDPSANWRIADLDKRAILSFSDAHSGPKLGREATVFDLEELNYEVLRKAIIGQEEIGKLGKGKEASLDKEVRLGKENTNFLTSTPNRLLNLNPAPNSIACTFEFYPEEGKYHYTGHRSCGVKQTPEETKKRGTVCHVCGKPLTVGVMHRVEELAAKDVVPVQKVDASGVRWMYHPENKKPPYVNLVPLLEILGEALETNSYSQKVLNEYEKLTVEVGSEFSVLLKASLEKIEKTSGKQVADAIKKVRAGDIFIDPGFDGEFGKVKIWGKQIEAEKESKAEIKQNKEEKEQMSLF